MRRDGIAVIIPHHADAERLARCLDALLPQAGPGVAVVVVDNATPGGLPPSLTARPHPALRLVTEPQKGAAHARNRGVAETTGEIVAFLDADCVPAPDWLAQVVRAAEGGDVVGGRIDLFDETPPPRSGAQAFEAVFAFDNRAYIADKGFSVTANLVTHRAVLCATGPFVHGLSEDLDWCRRAVAAGFRLTYAEGLRVAHPTRSDWDALRRKWRRLTEESFALSQGRRGRRLVWAGRALLMPVSALAHAPRIWQSPALHGGRERRAALAVLVRLRLARMGWMLGQALRG